MAMARSVAEMLPGVFFRQVAPYTETLHKTMAQGQSTGKLDTDGEDAQMVPSVFKLFHITNRNSFMQS